MDAFELILLIGVIQGGFLGAGLLIKNWGKQKQNWYFLALIGIITVALLAKFLFNVERYLIFPHLWFWVDLAAYAIGPLWYFTILNSIQARVRLTSSDWWRLSPVLYHLGFLLYLASLSREQLLSNAREGWFVWLFYVFCLTVLIVNGSFILQANQLLRRYRKQQFPDLLLKGQYVFLGILAVWLFSFLLSLVLTIDYSVNLTVYHYAFTSLSLLVMGMAFLALIRPASFYFLTQTYDDSENYVLQEIASKILRVLDEQRPYLSQHHSLQDLSSAVQANPVLTSKAINRILQSNFNDLMNERRVQYFLKLAREERAQSLTLWAIAQEAGFGNKTTFYKSFKKNTGTTPKAYLTNF